MDIETLIELERSGWDSLCAGTGATFYGELMTADAVMVLANGQMMGRDDVIAALADAPPWDSYEINDAQLIEISDDVAALVYVGTGFRGDGSEPFVGAMSSVYVLIDETWRLALYQQTAGAG